MVNIFLRTLIIFITLVIVMRLLGKRQIGEMQPFEFVVTLIIADLACIPMADVSIPLIYGIVAILGLFILHQLTYFIEQFGDFFKLAISGKPSIVLDKNGIVLKELKHNDMGVEDLIESMRSAGYFSLDDLDYAIFEANGKLSTLPSKNYQDKKSSIPIVLISDGKINKKNTEIINMNESSVYDFIKEKNTTLKKVEVMTVDGNGRVYFKTKNTPFEILNFPLKEGVKW